MRAVPHHFVGAALFLCKKNDKEGVHLSGISTFASHRILDFLLGRTAFAVPSIFHIGLSSTPLGVDGIGATEPADPNYRRVAISNDKVSFSVAANKIISIIRDFTFPLSSVNWPRCTHFLIYDNNVGGNIWFYGELQTSIDAQIDSQAILFANTNQLTLDICGGSTSDMAITTFAVNRIMNHLFGRTPVLTMPPQLFMGVSSTPLSAEGIGATEPSGGGYERLLIPNDKNSFTIAENKTVSFAREFRFPTSSTQWGNMTHFFISETPTGENVWWTGRLIHNRNVEVSTTLCVLPDGFRWILDECNTPTHAAAAGSAAIVPAIVATAFDNNAGASAFWGS
jgi:hypothetical protein